MTAIITYTIIPHHNGTAVLLIHSEHGWALPRLEIDNFRVVNQINQAVHQTWGLKVVVLRCLRMEQDVETQQISIVYELENLSSAWVVFPVGEWTDRDSLETLAPDNVAHQALLEDWLAEIEPPASRAPWAQPGWFETTSEWIYQKLHEHNIRARTSVEQVWVWARGCLLRVGTRGGDVYCKATLDARESLLLQWLAEDNCDHLPDLVDVEPERHQVLMRGFDGRPLYRCQRIATWETVLGQYADMQIAQIDHIDTLLAFGCPDRRLPRLAEQVSDFLLMPHSGLSDDELDMLRLLSSKFKGMCTALLSYDVPCTLIHSDFHADNIAVRGDQIIFFDWADAAISYPFFDLAHFLHLELQNHPFPNIPDARRRLQHAYLEPWTCFEPMEKLRAAFEMAYPLMMLYQAISYWQMVDTLEPAAQHEIAGTGERWLKTLLASIDV